MKIGIDARLALREPHGMGKYILNVVRELSDIDRENSYVLYTDKDDTDCVLPSRFAVKVLSSANYLVWEQILLPREAKRDGIDLLHSPANTAPIRLDRRVRLIMTIHDVMYLHKRDKILEPGNFYQRMGAFYRRMVVPRAAKRASLVMTDSRFSRDEILRYVALEEIPIEVVFLGCSYGKKTDDQKMKSLKQKYGIHLPYYLSFGGIAPRKNTKGVLHVFSQLKPKTGFQLVVTSIPSSAKSEFMTFARSLGIDSSVILLEYLPEDDLQVLLNHATMFLYLSLFEGFGLPVVEAMKCGTPVVASNLTSIPEIAEDAAILVSPDNENEILDAILKLEREPEIRQNLIRKGLERGNFFSWRTTAEKVLACYNKVAAKGV